MKKGSSKENPEERGENARGHEHRDNIGGIKGLTNKTRAIYGQVMPWQWSKDNHFVCPNAVDIF